MPDRLNQIVAGEPSLGMPHLFETASGIWDILLGAVATVWTDVDVSAITLPGTKEIYVAVVSAWTANVAGNSSNKVLLRRKGTARDYPNIPMVGGTISPAINGTYYEVWGTAKVGLDSNRKFQYRNARTGNADGTAFIASIEYYA